MPRIPKKDDFPPGVVVDIIPPTPETPLSNILILLHGLGDNQLPYTRLAHALKLPETCYLSMQAPTEMPMTDEKMEAEKRMFHWGDDLIFNAQMSGFESDVGFDGALKMLSELVNDVVIKKCGFLPREVFVWGYAQGGGVGLRLVEVLEQQKEESGKVPELGGVISVGGPWYEHGSSNDKYGPVKEVKEDGSADADKASKPAGSCSAPKFQTPVLLCRGSQNSAVSNSNVQRVKQLFKNVEVETWANSKGRDGENSSPPAPADFMPQNREHMLPLMKFFARRLRSRRGVPKGAVEVGRDVNVMSSS